MSVSDDYCERCDLPRSQCVHGMPAPADPPAAAKAKKPPAPRKRAAAAPGTATRTSAPVARRWTPPEVLSPVIVELLREAGGELSAEDLLAELGAAIRDRLRPGDEELTPGGELRWHYAARRARQALITEGVMVAGTQGVWKLTP